MNDEKDNKKDNEKCGYKIMSIEDFEQELESRNDFTCMDINLYGDKTVGKMMIFQESFYLHFFDIVREDYPPIPWKDILKVEFGKKVDLDYINEKMKGDTFSFDLFASIIEISADMIEEGIHRCRLETLTFRDRTMNEFKNSLQNN